MSRKRISKKIIRIYKEGGILLLYQRGKGLLILQISNFIRNIYFFITPPGFFYFNGKSLGYFRANYNLAFENERTVEIPIAKSFIQSLNSSDNLLEVGNVLANYGVKPFNRDVLDKYDENTYVINEDVVNFKPAKKYEAIISISTLEHVGWDEEFRDPKKIITAISNLVENCLALGGRMLVTMPFGYNDYLDKELDSGIKYFTETYYLKRISLDNKWHQVDYREVANSKYGDPFNNANAICIGVIRK
jgi:hypothetical protein